MLSIGILGLPNVGKSTLFKALTRNPVDISNYPFCTIEPNIGIVEVPDERLNQLALVSKPEKVVPAAIKFVDVAGLVKGAAEGEGLGNQFLAYLREADVLLHVVREFNDDNVVHVDGSVNADRDIETIRAELQIKDLETIDKRLEKIGKDVKQGSKEAKKEYELLHEAKQRLDDKEFLSSFDNDLLSSKPEIVILNGKDFDIKEEMEKAELSEKERKELGVELNINKLITDCYNLLDLITFFTIKGKEEARAWPIKRDSNILDGAELIHTDFREKFIKADVADWKQVVEKESFKNCLLKTAGKDYTIKDGDVLEIKI